MGQHVELRVDPGTGRFDPMDDRWLTQVGQFAVNLNREVGGVSHWAEPVPGTKGGVSSIVVSLGSAGVLTAAVEFFKSWLGQDRSRSLKVSFTVDGRLQDFEADSLSKDMFEDLVRAVTPRLTDAV